MELNDENGAATTDAEQLTDLDEDQISLEGRHILNRLSNVEESLKEKLVDIDRDFLSWKRNEIKNLKKLEQRLEENDRKLSKMEENEIKVFRKFDEMTAAFDKVNY